MFQLQLNFQRCITLFSRKTFAKLLILYLLLLILREFNNSDSQFSKGFAVRALIIKNFLEGSCGNIDYETNHTTIDNSKIQDEVFSVNSSINKEISKFEQELQKNHAKSGGGGNSKTNKFNLSEAEERLRNGLVKVGINVVYDSSFAEEFPQIEKLENYVRNIIFNAQLILNQEEISKHLKISLVVVKLKKSTQTFDESMQSIRILDSFGSGPDIEKEADMNLMITFRNLWMLYGSRNRFFETQRTHSENLFKNRNYIKNTGVKNRVTQAKSVNKILGQSQVDIFCNEKLSNKVLIFNAPSLCSGIILAHELAHAFSVEHDGFGSSRDCTAANHIMWPEIGIGRLRWSECTVRKLKENFIERINCIFDPIRVNKSVPFKPSFDFEKSSILPGKQVSIDAQCAQILGEISTSSLNKFQRNGHSNYETCQSLICSVGGFMEVDIGPAPAGSQCTLDGGYCSHGSCIKS